MGKLKEILSNNFKRALLREERKLPSDAEISACPSIYKGVSRAEDYLEWGFQHQLAGAGGTAIGEGIYSRLSYDEAKRCIGYYGPDIVQGKVLGGFKNYIMFDAQEFPSIRRQIERYYGANLSPEEQVKSIVKDPYDAQQIISAGRNMNSDTRIVKLCRRYGIRGMMYRWDNVATVLPFDFSSVIVWAIAKNVRYNQNAHLVRTFDIGARERYESTFDWDFQLFGRYDSYDRNKITRVATNNEMYALVHDNYKGYNFVKLDTNIVTNPQPEEISDIWFPKAPSYPSIRTGIFNFDYHGINFYATVFLPGENTAALWYPEDISKLNSPDINSITDWVGLDWATLQEVSEELNKYRSVMEGIKKNFKKKLNEAITDKDENEFVAKHRCYVYRATAPSNFKSIFSNGQLRQFAGSNDGSWYGEGVYAVINPHDVQYHKYDKETHNGGVKMIVLGGFSRFLIFNDEWAQKVYGQNHQIKDQIYKLFPREVADDVWGEIGYWIKNNIQGCQNTMFANGNRTTGILHVIFDRGSRYREKYIRLFSKYNIRGAIYVGGNDGLSMVCWNFDQVIPYQYTTDSGRNWHSDLFNFEEIKERSFRNNDPVQKFRHLYRHISDNIINCNIQGKNVNVTIVREDNGGWNIININDPKGSKISPFDFDDEPRIGISGIFNFSYQGVPLQGIILLPGANTPALWYPENPELLNSRPNVSNLNDWVGLEDIPEVVSEIKQS